MTKQEAKDYLFRTKVYVKDKSKEIQEKLFSLGIYWYDNNESFVKNIESPFLYIGKWITHGNNNKYFNTCDHKEITPEDILNIKVEPKFCSFKNKEECLQEMRKHSDFGYIKFIIGNVIYNIRAIYDNEIETIVTCPFKDALKYYTFTDGEPFGIKEEE